MSRHLRIAIISDRDADGGANIAALRVTEALAGAGHQVTAIYQSGGTYPGWETRLLPSKLATHTLPLPARAAMRLIPKSLLLARHQSDALRGLDAVLRTIKPDVTNIHNLHIGQWPPEMLRVASQVAPVVCTLHDTWWLTGRCVYPGTCTKYLSGCDASCPTPTEYPALRPSLIAGAWRARRDMLASCTNVAAVSPSDWLASLASAGLWHERPVFKIPYPIDLGVFQPLQRTWARRTMGLADTERVIVASASDLSSPRKGVRHILEALHAGVGQPVTLMLMGAPAQVPAINGVTLRQLGFIANDRFRALVYNCADVFVHSALEDNAPLTVIEALACGTPVVAFPVDGLPETVISRRTGWLADGVGSEPLRAALLAALQDLDDGLSLQAACRAFAESRYQPADVARQYVDVFESLLDGSREDSRLEKRLASAPAPAAQAR